MNEQTAPREPSAALLARHHWKKVEAPKTWRPKHNGDELVGYYGGRTTRNGNYGQYECVLVHVPARGCFMVSGTRILQLMDAASIGGLSEGWPVRIVFLGRVHLSEDREMKNFEVFVAEGDPVNPDELPLVRDDQSTITAQQAEEIIGRVRSLSVDKHQKFFEFMKANKVDKVSLTPTHFLDLVLKMLDDLEGRLT